MALPSSITVLLQQSSCNNHRFAISANRPELPFAPSAFFTFAFLFLVFVNRSFKSINLPACRQCTTPAGTLSAYPKPKGGHLKTSGEDCQWDHFAARAAHCIVSKGGRREERSGHTEEQFKLLECMSQGWWALYQRSE